MALPMDAPLGPWFRRHPRLAVVSALVLFVGIAMGRFITGDERDATLLLLVLPVALLALAFGLLAGTAAAVGSVGLLVGWVVQSGVELSALGWLSRVTPLLLLGVLIGHASDAQRRADAVAARLAIIEERQREAAEINDTIVQRLAVAKWSVESGDNQAGVDALEEVMEASQTLVVNLLVGLGGDGIERRRARAGPPPRRAGV
jgi:glucose-6-phosphate-specific signal transduction histidine kinase